MAVAYVIEQNASIIREGERLIVKKGDTILHSLHLFKLEQLVLFGNVSITPPAMASLLKGDVDTVFMSRNGYYRGRLQPLFSKNITLRCEQFKKMVDEGFRTEAARAIVIGKLVNMRTMLLRLNRSREDAGLDDNILSIKSLIPKSAVADGLDSLRGYEGRGTAVYFEGFSKGFLAEGVEFKKRVRRPPTDPVNALLSLGYTLLFNSVMAAVSLVGFDPYLGCLHTVDYGRPSLALDLMEEWRPVIVDSLVLGVFNLKTITRDDFVLGGTGDIEDGEDRLNDEWPTEGHDVENEKPKASVRLTDSGFRKFIAQFERKMNEKIRFHITDRQLSYRDCLREQVRHFSRYLKGEESKYQPISLR